MGFNVFNFSRCLTENLPKWSCDFMFGSPSPMVSTLLSLTALEIVVVLYQVISKKHVLKVFCGFIGRIPS